MYVCPTDIFFNSYSLFLISQNYGIFKAHLFYDYLYTLSDHNVKTK